jgi:hypothetical protein
MEDSSPRRWYNKGFKIENKQSRRKQKKIDAVIKKLDREERTKLLWAFPKGMKVRILPSNLAPTTYFVDISRFKKGCKISQI